MGDVDLAEMKRSRGKQIALMGNLHTTDVMLRGTPDEVYDASVKAIEDAGEGGGFILSNGRPMSPRYAGTNTFAMVWAARNAGTTIGKRAGSSAADPFPADSGP